MAKNEKETHLHINKKLKLQSAYYIIHVNSTKNYKTKCLKNNNK